MLSRITLLLNERETVCCSTDGDLEQRSELSKTAVQGKFCQRHIFGLISNGWWDVGLALYTRVQTTIARVDTLSISKKKKIQRFTRFFWGGRAEKEVTLIEFILSGATVNAAWYRKTLEKLCRVIENRKRSVLKKKICFFRGKIHLRRGLPYFLQPRYHFFYSRKKRLGRKRMEIDEETEKKITWRLETVLAAWLRYGIKKPLSRYEKRIRVNCKKYEYNVTHIN